MTKVQKFEVVQAINDEINRLGSGSQVAQKCGVSAATISQMRNENWKLIKISMWQKVASKLNVNFSEWQIATNVTNTKILQQVFSNAKKYQLFTPVSEKAGSGKSAGAIQFITEYSHEGSFYIQCREWAKREFLENLSQSLGITKPKGMVTIDKLGESVINFFEDRIHLAPLLAIDEADKLKPAALRFLITLYNRLEDKIGLVILGTENLEKEIKRGVKLQKKGFDEIDSRFGRNYIKLIGNTKADIKSICAMNGITDTATQSLIFKESNPIKKKVEHLNTHPVFVTVVEDMRRVKRVIKRELIKRKTA